MSAYIPVAPDRWAEMVQASAEVGPLRNKVSDLSTQLELRQVEIDRLRAEVERLKFELECRQRSYDFMHGQAVERMSEILRLEDENEWLRKADRLVCWNPATEQWEVRYEAPK